MDSRGIIGFVKGQGRWRLDPEEKPEFILLIVNDAMKRNVQIEQSGQEVGYEIDLFLSPNGAINLNLPHEQERGKWRDGFDCRGSFDPGKAIVELIEHHVGVVQGLIPISGRGGKVTQPVLRNFEEICGGIVKEIDGPRVLSDCS